MTSRQQIAKFIADIERWTLGVFEARGQTDVLTKRKLNKWISELRPVWYQGMKSLNMKSSFEGMAGLGITFEEFEKNYRQTVTALSRVDWTKASMLQRGLIKKLGNGGYKPFFKKYDELINNFSGKPLGEVQKLFLKSVEAKKISFVDVAGRQWEPKTYASMWSRTRSSEVANETMLAEMKADDANIVQITVTGTTTPICILYEGKYFSLDGRGGLPKLEYSPPFHPNCRHRMLAVTSSKIEEYKMSNRRLDKIIQEKSSGFTDAEWTQIKRQQQWLKLNRPV